MKPHSFRPRIRLALVALAAAAVASPPPSKTQAGPADDIGQRIDALLKRRLNPDPLPSVLPNPFVIVTAGTASRDLGEARAALPAADPRAPADPSLGIAPAAPAPLESDKELLENYASELRIGGLIQQKDEVQIFINGIPKREGDVVVVDRGTGVVSIEVVRILPHSLVLGFNGARATLKF